MTPKVILIFKLPQISLLVTPLLPRALQCLLSNTTTLQEVSIILISKYFYYYPEPFIINWSCLGSIANHSTTVRVSLRNCCILLILHEVNYYVSYTTDAHDPSTSLFVNVTTTKRDSSEKYIFTVSISNTARESFFLLYYWYFHCYTRLFLVPLVLTSTSTKPRESSCCSQCNKQAFLIPTLGMHPT